MNISPSHPFIFEIFSRFLNRLRTDLNSVEKKTALLKGLTRIALKASQPLLISQCATLLIEVLLFDPRLPLKRAVLLNLCRLFTHPLLAVKDLQEPSDTSPEAVFALHQSRQPCDWVLHLPLRLLLACAGDVANTHRVPECALTLFAVLQRAHAAQVAPYLSEIASQMSLCSQAAGIGQLRPFILRLQLASSLWSPSFITDQLLLSFSTCFFQLFRAGLPHHHQVCFLLFFFFFFFFFHLLIYSLFFSFFFCSRNN